MANDYDVIIIGTGAGGGTLAHRLAPSGKRILLLERGDYLRRSPDNWDSYKVFRLNKYKTHEQWYDKDGEPFHPGQHYYVGGQTKFYGAILFRLRERDFGEVRHYGGISPAWPLSYQDLQPYYAQAQRHNPFHLPVGVDMNESDPEKGRCVRCDRFDGFPCLTDGKADSHVLCVRPALEHDNIELITHAKVERLETDAGGGSVTGVVCERKGREETYIGDIVVVSCGA